MANSTNCSCCIDKTSTAELSESINSMFRWYQKAKVCYAYLEDVDDVSEFARSRWFTRGWTLQELIAPKDLYFYSTNWALLGNKNDLQGDLETITGISRDVLSGATHSRKVCIATRMRWAANRQTTRIEDIAYCLMGIFDVQMPLLYGEGKRAFARLQQEIMRGSDDQSLFAWGVPESPYPIEQLNGTLSTNEACGLLADSPRDFLLATEVQPVRSKQPPTATSKSSISVQIELPVARIQGREVAILACTMPKRPGTYLGFRLNHWDTFYTSRGGELMAIQARDWVASQVKKLEMREIGSGLPRSPPPVISIADHVESPYYSHPEIHALPGASYFLRPAATNVIVTHNYSGPSAVMIYEPTNKKRGRNRKDGKPNNYVGPATGFALILGVDPRPWVAFIPILHPDHAQSQFYHLAEVDPGYIKFCTTKASLLAALSKGQGDWDFFDTAGKNLQLDLVLDRWTGFHFTTSLVGKYERSTIHSYPENIELQVRFNRALHDFFVDSEVSVKIFCT